MLNSSRFYVVRQEIRTPGPVLVWSLSVSSSLEAGLNAQVGEGRKLSSCTS